MPWYTFAARASSPWKRTWLNSVSTMPGSMLVTRMPAPSRSMRIPRVSIATAAFVAQ